MLWVTGYSGFGIAEHMFVILIFYYNFTDMWKSVCSTVAKVQLRFHKTFIFAS
jgi:hypothetical protein